MPDYGATPAELSQYGSNLNLWQSLMLLQRWSPLIGFGQRFVQEVDPYKKSIIVGEASEWLASRESLGYAARAGAGVGVHVGDAPSQPGVLGGTHHLPIR